MFLEITSFKDLNLFSSYSRKLKLIDLRKIDLLALARHFLSILNVKYNRQSHLHMLITKYVQSSVHILPFWPYNKTYLCIYINPYMPFIFHLNYITQIIIQYLFFITFDFYIQ